MGEMGGAAERSPPDAVHALNRALEQRISAQAEELQAKEQQLRDALTQTEKILTASAAGILVFQHDGQCLLANPAAAALFGESRLTLLSRRFRDFEAWGRSGLLTAAEQAFVGGEKVETEVNLTPSPGRTVWVNAQFSPFNCRGEPHLLLTLQDITEKKWAAEALAKREREFRSLADNVPDSIIRYDLEGRILYVNRALERVLERRAEDLIGKTTQEAVGAYDSLGNSVLEVGTTGQSREIELFIPAPGGKLRYHAFSIVPEPGGDGDPVSVLAVGRDLTEQRMAEEGLRLAANVFHNSAEGVVITDAANGIVWINPAFTEITGYAEAEVLGANPSLLRSDRHGPEFYAAMWDSLAAEGRWQGEIWNRRKNGEAYLEWLTINRIEDQAGNPIRYVGVFHDITEMRQKDEHIRHLAFHDALTALPNRTLMLDRLDQAISRCRRGKCRLSVTFIDLDRFKAINDGLGHDIGDLMLQEVALRIKRRLRAMDTVARLGGDEFMVLMEGLDHPEDCACLARDLIAEIARPMELHGHVVEVGASMGIAVFPDDATDPLELMKRADTAMYAAKAAGKNTYRFFRHEMLERASQRLTLEMDLRRGIAASDLELRYQPKIHLRTGELLGVEALLRWRHPTRGLLGPDAFLPLAEESGLMADVGTWVLNEACRQAAKWRACGRRIPIAVNISAGELESGDLVDRVVEITRLQGIDPRDVEIELTESTVMANPEAVASVLTRLRNLGVTVAVDDFGTGYSSLAYLRRLPIDTLKVDRSFVRDADHDEGDAQIVRTILALSDALKLAVVAEGVETVGQADLLRSIGCSVAQGYLFSPPLPPAELEVWMDSGARHRWPIQGSRVVC